MRLPAGTYYVKVSSSKYSNEDYDLTERDKNYLTISSFVLAKEKIINYLAESDLEYGEQAMLLRCKNPTYNLPDDMHYALMDYLNEREDISREDMENAISNARDHGIGIFAMKPLGGGHLIESGRDALLYAFRLLVRSSWKVLSEEWQKETEQKIREAEQRFRSLREKRE